MCRVKANEEKHSEGGTVSVFIPGIQAVKRKELHVLGKGDWCIIPFLLLKEMFTGGKDELQQGSHTRSRG